MIVRCEQNIKSGILNSLQIFVGCTESRVTPIGLSAESHLKVADCNIGMGDLFLYESKARRIIVFSVGGTGSVYLCLVLHQISYK